MALYNRKHFKCSICNRKHYARGYCKKHWNNIREGRQLEPQKCNYPGCNSRVLVHIKEQLCSNHFPSYFASLHPRYKRDGGKWGYKDYRKIKKFKKKKCELCDSKKNLDIHHEDLDPRNSNVENLITVCRKCHLRYFHKKYKHPKLYKKKGSKYKRLYGKTLKEIAMEKNCPETAIFKWLSSGKKLENFELQKKKIPNP